MAQENQNPVSVANFSLVLAGDEGVTYNYTAAQLRVKAVRDGATLFNRAEDAAWDPRDVNDARDGYNVYFTTTSYSRLYRLTFRNITAPLQGGLLELVVDGGALGYIAFDNIALDQRGHALVVSDSYVPLNNLYTVNLNDKSIRTVGVYSSEYFGSASQPPQFPFTSTAEFSGQIDMAGNI